MKNFNGICELAETLVSAPRAGKPGQVLNLVARLSKVTRASLNDPIRKALYSGRVQLIPFAPCVGAHKVMGEANLDID